MAKLSDSDRQLDDVVAGILRMQRGQVGTNYIESWVGALELEWQWQTACEKAIG